MKRPRFFETHEALEDAAQAAEDAWRVGQWPKALRLYCEIYEGRCRDIGQHLALTPADLTILERITDLAVPFGFVTDVDVLLAAIAERYLQLSLPEWADRIRVKRVHLALNEHRLDRAIAHWEELCGSRDVSIQSVQNWEETYDARSANTATQELFAQAWLELGRIFHLQGRNRPALLCFDHGLAHAPVSQAVQLSLEMAVVRCLVEIGEFEPAGARLKACYPDLDSARQPGQTAAWHEAFGKLHLLSGDLGAAQRSLQAVWTICRKFGFAGPMLRSAMNLAQTLILVNQTIEARGILERVVAAAAEQGETRVAVQARRLLDVAGARFGGAETRPASVKDEQAAEGRVVAADPELSPGEQVECYTLAHFEDRALQFQWYLRRRELVAARKSLERLRPFRETDSVLIHLRLDVMAAMLEFHSGRVVSARGQFTDLVPRLATVGLKSDRWQVQVLLSRCMPDGEERSRLREQNDRLLEELGNTLPIGERVSYFLDKATELDEAIGARVQRLQDLEQLINQTPLLRRPALRLALWRETSHLLDAAYWMRESHHARLLQPSNAVPQGRSHRPLWRRLLLTSPAQATVAFLVLPDSTVTVCQRWLSLSFQVSSAGRYEIRRDVGRWHQLAAQSNPEAREATLRALATALKLDALVAGLPRFIRRLRLLPDDALHGAPFAALELPGTDGRTYWSDRFAVSIAFQPEPRSRRRAGGSKPLIIGVARGSGQLPPLVRTSAQVSWVRQWFERRGHAPICLTDEDATAEAVSANLPAATFLHTSSHGDFVQDCPERTGLLLAGAAGSATLSLMHLAAMDLSRVQHATLVACWAADNFVLPGRWILSLPEALWRAGTGTVLASLWEVEEAVAERFVMLFYENLPGRRPDVALRRVQRQLRASGGRNRDPQVWAGFQLYGDPRRLSL